MSEARQADGRYAELFDLAPVAYFTLDRAGTILQTNLEMARLLGRSRSELIGQEFLAVAAIEERARFRQHLDWCFTNLRRATVELALWAPQERRVFEIISTPLVDHAGAAVSCMMTLTDISALKASEERLRLLSETSEALASSLDYSTTLATAARLTLPVLADVAFVDVREDDGRIVRCEPGVSMAVEAIADTPQAHVLAFGEPLLCARAPGPTVLMALSGTAHRHLDVREGSLLLVPLTVRGRTLGVLTCVMVQSGRQHTPDDLALAEQVASRAAMAIDNARLYRAAQRAIRAREDVVAIVSHDLRNPLQGIRLNSQHLLESPGLPPEAARSLKTIDRGVGIMERLINDLLDLSQIEAGQLRIAPSECDAAAIAFEAAELMRPLAEHKRIALTAASSGGHERVRCDRQRILQVLANLLGNAIKFTSEGGAVALEIVRDGQHVLFRVSDTGEGIAPEQLPHIFDRYWHGETHQRMGIGLGLFIAKGIIDAHGGRIGVESRVGSGTTVTVTLATVAEQVAAAPIEG